MHSALQYTSLLDLATQADSPLLSSVSSPGTPHYKPPLTHARFKRWLEADEAGLSACVEPGWRVGLCLPQGPTAFTALLATMARACACPVRN